MIFINQIRMKIGVMFGNPETTTGGNALKFYASVRMDIRRIGALKDGDNIVGGRTRVKVVKNKMAPPFKEAEFDLLYGTGISRDGEIVDLGSEMGIVEKSGAWYSFGGERIGQGREAAKQFLKDHPETAEHIMAKVMEKVGLKRTSRSPRRRNCGREKKKAKAGNNEGFVESLKRTSPRPSHPIRTRRRFNALCAFLAIGRAVKQNCKNYLRQKRSLRRHQRTDRWKSSVRCNYLNDETFARNLGTLQAGKPRLWSEKNRAGVKNQRVSTRR